MSKGIFSQYDAQDLNRLAAKGILEKLRNIRQRINVDFTARRLIWELIQNAKDNASTCNINGNPKVSIDIDLQQDKLIFSHNNGYFKNENVRGLIRRYSSSEKDREYDKSAIPPTTTGRFGTGFMTTHLLSEKVIANGVFQEKEDSFCRFELPLDRTGLSEKEIIQSIENSFSSVEESMENSSRFPITEAGNFRTEFLYNLDKAGYDLADISVSEFNETVPYALINIPNIEKIQLKKDGKTFNYAIRKIKELSANGLVISVMEAVTDNDDILFSHFISIDRDNIRITIPVRLSENGYSIECIPKKLPKLFLDFPLIGTEDLNIPFIINCPLFEPTDSRDGISLTGGEDRDTQRNTGIIEQSFNLFTDFLDIVCISNKWQNIFNLARIKKPQERIWINQEWFDKKILVPFRSHLLTLQIVDSCHLGERKSIKNLEGEDQMFFPSANDRETREKIWDLSVDLKPESLPDRNIIHEWYSIIWDECAEITVENLALAVQKRQNLKTLAADLKRSEEDTITWLNRFFELLNHEGKYIDEVIKDKIAVLLDQNGDFRKKKDLFTDASIEEELKNVLMILGIDIRASLLDTRIITASSNKDSTSCEISFNKIEQKNIIIQINQQLLRNPNSQKAENYLISLFSDSPDFPKYRTSIYEFCKSIMGEEIPPKKNFNTWDNSIWEIADRGMISLLVIRISGVKSFVNLQIFLKHSSETETEKWIQSFIDLLVETGNESFFNLVNSPVLPNQKGEFRIKDSLFFEKEDIDELLKDIAGELGYDVRSELLHRNIRLTLPENRGRTLQQVAEEIAKRIKPVIRDLTAREEKKEVIRKLYFWMSKNSSVAVQIFGDVYDKRFLMIGDDEIASNFTKAEILDEILEGTGIGVNEAKEKLKALLCSPRGKALIANPAGNFGTDGGFYPEGSEDDIQISRNLIDDFSERVRISISEEAKIRILEVLKEKGFIIPPDLSFDYTIVQGIAKPDGTPVIAVLKSAKGGHIYFNPLEWLAFSEPGSQLFILTSGNIVRNITLDDLESANPVFHMRFNTDFFALDTNLKAFAEFFRYLPNTHFIFVAPISTSDFMEEFGLYSRNPSAGDLTADDKNLLR